MCVLFLVTSESRQAYGQKFVPAVRASAPDRWKPHDAPFDGVSTNSLAYVNHGPVQARKAAPRHSMMDTGVGKNNVPFDDTTTVRRRSSTRTQRTRHA